MGLLIHLLVIVMIVKCQADTCGSVDDLKAIVSINLNKVNTELRDTKDQVVELKGTVSSNQEMVTSEVRGIRRQLEELHVSVSALVELLKDTSPTDEASASDATEGSKLVTTTEAASSSIPKDCSEILARGVSMSGVYTVQPLDSGEAFEVYCDMETDGGGWTVFQRRQDGSVDFDLDFASYSRGFGDLEGEFWLGNDNLHRLTAQGEYELRVDLSDFEDESRYAVYDTFSITDASNDYRPTVGNYSGTAGDAMSYHNGAGFKAKDSVLGSCARSYHGGWWFYACFHAHLNGKYLHGTTTDIGQGIVWKQWKGFYYSLKTSEMKIRATP